MKYIISIILVAGVINAGELQMDKFTGSLRITGAPTTNAMTAIWGCTNASTGQGNLNMLPKIWVEKLDAQPNTFQQETIIRYTNILAQVGGTWDGTNWTPGVVGWIQANVTHTIVGTQTGDWLIRIQKNGVDTYYGQNVYVSAVSYPTVEMTKTFYNDNATNYYSIGMFNNYAVTVTNFTTTRRCLLNWTTLP